MVEASPRARKPRYTFSHHEAVTMRFDLEALRSHPGQPFHLDGDLSIPDLEWQGEVLHVEGVVHVGAWASWRDGEVELRVAVQGRVHRLCARCLAELVERVDSDHVLDVLPEDTAGRYLELRPFVEAGLRLGLQGKPLCRPGCRGICPECGADLNHEDHRPGCHGGGRPPDPRLSKLRGLLDELP